MVRAGLCSSRLPGASGGSRRRHGLRNHWLALICALLLATVGCVSMQVHRVKPGETLYSIAWQYGLNWHRLAKWNDISPPYTIYAGQRLRLNGRVPLDGSRKHADVARSGPESSGSATPDADTGPVVSVPYSSAGADAHAADGGHWVWPVATADIGAQEVSASRQGIDISGALGTPVLAARAGRVVYSGSGLPGYGKLVIVKHDGHYLSAYGFNSRLLVSEGAQVAAGEKIAEMGLGPGQSPMLHFEIRHDGQPLSVVDILPARR